MTQLSKILDFLDQLAPNALAEEWDNVGLLVGDRGRDVSAIITCLTLTTEVADEAVNEGAQLIVTHHPVMFRPVQRITGDNIEGQILLKLIEAGIAVYSPHTGYDSAAVGINRQLAELFELQDIGVLRPAAFDSADAVGESQHQFTDREVGGGRFGNLPAPVSLADFVGIVKQRLGLSGIQYVGDAERRVQRIGVTCGSAAEFLPDAERHGCDALLTGEARFHASLEAQATGIALVLAGHYATERPAVERLADILARQFPTLRVWASLRERDPIRWA